MTTEFYKYRANLERKYSEGYSDAMTKIKAAENDKNYYGNELVAKVRKHDGSEFYYVRDEVFEEIMVYMQLINEVCETVYAWENVSGTPKNISKKDVLFMYFIEGLKFNKKYLNSMKKCFKGSPMMNFCKDLQEIEKNANAERMKSDVASLWGF